MSAARVYPFEKSNASNIRTKSGDYIFLPLSRDLFFVTRRNYYACVFFRTIYMYVLYVFAPAYFFFNIQRQEREEGEPRLYCKQGSGSERARVRYF